MIMYVTGNLFQSPAQVLVNTVNTVGAMGKGVALQFRQLYPEMYREYRELCERGEIRIGRLWLYKSENKWILNFPTKKHWRNPSRVEYIEKGLLEFRNKYREWNIHTIAFPPLGCGNGRLDFETQVQPLMEKYLRNLPIDVFIYPARDDEFVAEHEDPEAMRKWLRSQPTSLPFSEVWDDLVRLLERRTQFETVVRGSPFEVLLSEDGTALEVLTKGQQRRRIARETLLAFWQQLRDYGFSMRQIAPALDRELSYLIPLFRELPYVKPVKIAEDYGNLKSSFTTGLQVLAENFQIDPQYAQLGLFEPTFE